jgi:hypothetical protein
MVSPAASHLLLILLSLAPLVVLEMDAYDDSSSEYHLSITTL